MEQHALFDQQKALCTRYGVPHVPAPDFGKIGIAANLRDGAVPLNGLRHPPTSGMTGWYLWAGETWSDDPAFLAPLHLTHLTERCPQLLPYLGLPPGWRFLIAGAYEDVWYDAKLLNI
jgi:hypothetical protein